jgi:diguanylate cyclase (GGDEF)-like protein/PAS domain S-box-containing protein
MILWVLWLHVGGVAAYARWRGYSLGHTSIDSSILIVFAAAATQPWGGRVLRSTLASLGLMSASALVVHLSGGLIEAHFHYFVMVSLLSLYQDWVPFLLALAFVVLEHGVLGALRPQAVYSNPDSVLHPWKWALIHGGFVLAAAAANVYSWLTSEEDHRRASDEMARREEAFRTLFQENPQPMWVFDVRTLRFLAVNRSACVLYGYSADEFLGMRITDIRSPEETDKLLGQLRQTAPRSAMWEHRAKDGRMINAEVHSQAMSFRGVDARLVVVTDMTERVGLERELSHRAFHDGLTDLANRELFYDRLGRALDRTARNRDPMAVVTLDIDDFKGVNDAHGHGAGDLLLTEMARRLRGSVRPVDTCARLGGDEFAVLLEGMDGAQAATLARRLLTELRRPFVVDGAEIWPTASIGVAAASDAMRGDDLLRQADVAAYEAKAGGKDRIEVFTPGMHSGALSRAAVAIDLRRAIDRDELFLEYQPVVRVDDGTIVGVEALVRWRHPERGVLSPGEFVSIAEDTGLIVPIGAWVLEEACRQVRSWECADDRRRIRLSVNVSPRQMRERDFAASLLDVLARTGFDPAQLVVEVTESALVDDVPEACRLLERLRAAGVRIALDDFGTGYSSLGYLRGLPLDVVKIDRLFVAGLGDDEAGRELALAIVRLVDTLGLPVVAEGVETARELDYICALGVDYAQGFHFSGAVDREGMEALLAGPAYHVPQVSRRRRATATAGSPRTTGVSPASRPPAARSPGRRPHRGSAAPLERTTAAPR